MKLKNYFLNLKNKITSLFLKNKKLFIFTSVLIFVLLFCVITYFSSSKNESKNDETNDIEDSSFDSYETMLEHKLSKMILSISEIDSVSVMVVCDSTIRYEYLKNTEETISTSESSSSTNSKEEVAYEKNGSNNLPIIVSSTMPKVVGVWVIVNGVSSSTKLAIKNSIVSVLNINESCISILQER